MKIKNQRDFFSGLVFMAAGSGTAWVAASLRVGNAARMGQGYFAALLGAALAVLGAFIAFKALAVETEDGGMVEARGLRAAVSVAGAVVLFAVLAGGLPPAGIAPLGLVPATCAATWVAALAAPGLRWRHALLLAIALAAVAWLLPMGVPALSEPLRPAAAR